MASLKYAVSSGWCIVSGQWFLRNYMWYTPFSVPAVLIVSSKTGLIRLFIFKKNA